MDPSIPVVDLGKVSELLVDSNQDVRRLADEIHRAFCTVGFVYVKNHGIPQKTIDAMFKLSEDFFKLDTGTKEGYARPESGSCHGWVALERERVSADRPGDYKEAFNISEPLNDSRPWPDKWVPNFRKEALSFFQLCRDLALRILNLVALGLQLKDPNFFSDKHKYMESTKNSTTLRLLSYPSIPEGADVKPGQTRCGEHTDYGSITLLFQDEMPGLEVLPLHCKEYVPAPPLPGTVVVNVADLMQRWTADQLKSTRHRVSIPAEMDLRPLPRRSIAYFVHPEDNVLIECLDGSEKYPPITAYDYLFQRLNATYRY